MKLLINICLLTCLLWQHANGQHQITKEYPKDQFDYLILSNFNGNMDIEESTGSTLVISIENKDKTYPEGFSLELVERDNYLAVFLKTPCTKPNDQIQFDINRPFNLYSIQDEQSYECHLDMDPFEDFPELVFKVSLPASVHLVASLVNGDISVENSKSNLHINNVMGNIAMKNVQHVKEAKTVNGNVDIQFLKQPTNDVDITTVNGDIDIHLVKDASFEARFKSFQGDLFTDFESSIIQEKPLQTIADHDQSLHVKIKEYTLVKIGEGGYKLTMETINGNAYLKTI